MFLKRNWKGLLISIFIALVIGMMAAYLIYPQVNLYLKLRKPPMAPSIFVFPLVWTILYILMGISSYMVYMVHSYSSKEAMKVYFLQLFVNFLWPIVFFKYRMDFLALLVLVLLWMFVVVMIITFHQINRKSAYLQFPYMIWITFALYLNAGIWILNF